MQTDAIHDKIELFDYSYPESLVATEPRDDFRILFSNGDADPREINRDELFDQFSAGDVLVINDTRVERRRVMAESAVEVLFCEAESLTVWQVLFPARDFRVGDVITLPGGISAELIDKGLPQRVRLSLPLPADYFERHGDLALPPYIQKARGERSSRLADERWYQTQWAKVSGSQAAPTASLHFRQSDLAALLSRGVQVCPLTLHVGIGTFLPLKTERLAEHRMHGEPVFVPRDTVMAVAKAKAARKRVWALGTTVVRALESFAVGKLGESPAGWSGRTDLFIRPGYRFAVVNAMLTNFHQPRSTLLAMVAAFAGLERAQNVYRHAVANQFRLFSYGDLSVWIP